MTTIARFDPNRDADAGVWRSELEDWLECEEDRLQRAKTRGSAQCDLDLHADRVYLLRKLLWQGWGVRNDQKGEAASKNQAVPEPEGRAPHRPNSDDSA